jgi:group I intron endonuclease
MRTPVIYKIINTLNNNFYVGSTHNQYERFRTHRNKLRGNRHHCAHLQAAWNKYGEAAFVFHVVETLADVSLLQAAEDVWLKNWVGKEECYNHGMRSGAPWRGAPKETHPMYGKEVSEETKQLIREARLRQPDPRFGKTHSAETKALISAKKRANPSKPWEGKERSEETRRKIGDAQRGVKKNPRVYTPEGLEKARENMRRHAVKMETKSFDAVYAKFPQEVKDKYDFTNAVYTGALVRIEGVKCSEHGIFSQYAAQFRKGRGCPSCGAGERAESKRKQMKEAWATEEGRKTFLDNRPNKLLAPTT